MSILSDTDLDKAIEDAELRLLQLQQKVEEVRYQVFGLKWVRDQHRSMAPDTGDVMGETGQA